MKQQRNEYLGGNHRKNVRRSVLEEMRFSFVSLPFCEYLHGVIVIPLVGGILIARSLN
jgi:hypothetical protein